MTAKFGKQLEARGKQVSPSLAKTLADLARQIDPPGAARLVNAFARSLSLSLSLSLSFNFAVQLTKPLLMPSMLTYLRQGHTRINIRLLLVVVFVFV